MDADDDYLALRAFFAWFASERLGLDDPLARLRALEACSAAQAARGLRLGIEDCLELTADLPVGEVRGLDAALEALGLPTLSQVRAECWRRPRLALARGAIRTEAERRAVAALAESDVDEALSDACRTLLAARRRRWPAAAD